MCWSRVFALVVLALLALRVVTAPRAMVSVAALAPETDHASSHATSSLGDVEVLESVDDVVEARQIRRARPVEPDLLPYFVTIMGAALLAAAALVRRHDPRIDAAFASRAVPVLGGRAPPAFSH